MKRKTLVIALLLSSAAASVQAARLPASGGYDSRVQQIVYNPNDVTIVKTKAGVVTLIQLEEGEFLKGEDTGLGIGDPEAWNTAVKGSNIFLRPKAEQPDTNIAIVTNRRSYSIMLTSTDNNPTYVLRYVYPKAPEPVKANVMLGKSQVSYPCTEGNLVNGRYEVKGSQKIKPDALWDNGRMTCLRWNSATDLPVASRVMPDGKEQLVNFHMDKNVMVLHEVSPEFVLRLGNEVMQLRTAGNVKRAWNANGTTTGDVRVEK